MTIPVPQPRPAVADLPGYVAGRRASSAATAALASNESHEPPLPGVVEAIAEQALRANRYPDMGAVALREAIAGYVGLDPAQVAVGPGSVAVLQQAISAVCDAGDEVIFAWRSFEAYPILTAIAGAVAVRVPLRADESHDLPAMAAAVTDRTKVVLLCSPNNPTGVRLAVEDVAGFLDQVPPDVLVILDEAYVDYTDDPGGTTSLALLARYPNLCLLRTLSKAWGLAGLRVGYALASAEIAEPLRRTAIPFGVSAVAQAAAVAALAAADEVRVRAACVVSERGRMIEALRGYGWQTPDSVANFVWLRADDELLGQLMEAFDTADILVRGYAGDGIRISLADPASNDRVLAVLADRSRFGR
ncbi:MAG: histidinol-phosphate transaminase [Propionicimonas sp.]|uniref:histidinol-phosphate transaminase n=1 Tax=Propionicimonas sp. TaxID=1955623 RepID=UPI002B1FBA3B|nr:histidinol-phosphate transaminase [Propionicimonas sp.]MEA4945639.1 histidinol-phosphate transaminase [Propionicimonas sp.]